MKINTEKYYINPISQNNLACIRQSKITKKGAVLSGLGGKGLISSYMLQWFTGAIRNFYFQINVLPEQYYCCPMLTRMSINAHALFR